MKKTIIIFTASLFLTGCLIFVFSDGVFGITESELLQITVSGTLYNSDCQTPASGMIVSIYAAPDNKITTPQIKLGSAAVNSNTGAFQVSSYNFDMLQRYNDNISDYNPAENHVYVVFYKDNNALVKDSDGGSSPKQRPDRIDLGVITSNTSMDIGDINFREPNVFGSVLDESGIYKQAMRAVITKVGEEPTFDDQMITLQGSGFWFYREPGEYIIKLYKDPDDWSSPVTDDDLLRTLSLTVGENGARSVDIYTDENHSSEESFIPISEVEASPSISQLLSGVNRTELSKDTVGLNTHLALTSSTGYDGRMIDKLEESGTKWAREWFDTSKDPSSEESSWRDRYENVRDYYYSRNINIVATLAYNFDGAASQPDLDRWSEYVTNVVTLYKDYIKVWEVWNEPDLEKFLSPNTVENYIPILRTAYQAIKAADSNALVLNAPTSWPNATFIEKLYQQGSAYFDELALHVYYCDQYKTNGNNRQLQVDFAKVMAVVNKYRSSDRIWITELGCSTYDNYSEDFQREYLSVTVPYLLSTNYVEKILLFNIIDRNAGDPYENNFGLLHTDFSSKPAWDWYLTLSGSSQSTPLASGKSFFAYSQKLRGGYQIASGNVLGDGKDEIIAGTGDGLAPHVRIFDQQGNVFSQFFAFDSSLRNGVTVSACDINGDGHEEIVTAQGKGGWPIVKIFDGYGNVINSGFSVLDGKFTGGVNLSCGDIDGNGTSEIIVAARQGGGPHVLVYNQEGRTLANFMAYDPNFRGGINVTAIDMDDDDKEEIVTGPQYGAPHVQIFKIKTNAIQKLSPGFYAFSPQYRGGVSVGGADIDGDGAKELMVGVGDNARSAVKVYNIKEVVQKQFYAYATNFLGGVNVAGGDVDGDGTDEVLTIPRGSGGPNVRVIEGSSL